jgi:putative multiple sugar transport system ATP-binding protein
MAETILKMENIIKEFSGVKALSGVSLEVTSGEIHALCGENGAGKSTLMNILSGVIPYGNYQGSIEFDGKPCAFKNIRDSEKAGIVIIHQELSDIENFSIAENMFLSNERGSFFNIDWEKTKADAKSRLETVGLYENPDTLIKDIGIGKRQLCEIAKALSKDVRLLILDEPTSSLNEKDSENLLKLLIRLKGEGITSIIISHKLNEISYVADRITVIRDGSVIETIENNSPDYSEDRIIKDMVGRELKNRYPEKQKREIGETVFELQNWTVYDPIYRNKKIVDGVNLSLKKGEIVGIAGLIGAGRTELAMSVFGRSYGSNISGTLKIKDREVTFKTIRDAINAGLAYVTEDRKENGLILNETIAENTVMAKPEKISRHGIIDFDLQNEAANAYKERLHTKATDVNEEVKNLSGGNQQKVLLSKWIFADPEILILDEPTRGIDVGAKYEIYLTIQNLAMEGKTILLISSEMPELLGITDRIYVMNEGRIVGEMETKTATQEKIMTLIINSAVK